MKQTIKKKRKRCHDGFTFTSPTWEKLEKNDSETQDDSLRSTLLHDRKPFLKQSCIRFGTATKMQLSPFIFSLCVFAAAGVRAVRVKLVSSSVHDTEDDPAGFRRSAKTRRECGQTGFEVDKSVCFDRHREPNISQNMKLLLLETRSHNVRPCCSSFSLHLSIVRILLT